MAQGKVVADASVIAKWFLHEPYSENATRLRDEHARGSLKIIVPALLLYEALNALKDSGRYSSFELQEVSRSLSLYGLAVKGPTLRLLQFSARIGVERAVSIYDASYIALAEQERAILYTADEELLQKFPRRAKHIKDFRPKTRER